jgi:hypothetical protein
MNKQHIISQATLAGNQECKVLYHKAKDIVELEVGGISLRLAASNFFMMNEMMRKAAAKLVMQTELHQVFRIDSAPAPELQRNDKKAVAPALALKSLQHV